MRIEEIQITDRYRKDFGDIESLAKSIEELGLLHAVIVDSNNRLIDGERRIRAYKHLGRAEIDARVINVPSLLRAEHDANEFAKQWTVSERVAIAKAIEAEVRERAKERMLAGVKLDVDPVDNYPQGATKSRDEIAERAGLGSSFTLRNAEKVIDQGTPELVEAVDRGEVAVSTAAKIAELPKEEQTEIVARGPKEILEAAKQIRADKAKEIRAQRIEKIAKIAEGNTELPTGKKYAVVYADPPWRYDVVISTSREIENHYPTMSIEDICSMPVDDFTTPDAIIFLWVTSPLLEKGIAVLNAWGFDYKSSFVWVKDRIGMGFYNRTQHEFLLVGTKGKIPAPSPEHRVSSVINATRGEHSEKPEVVSTWIETWYEGLPKIELFCRSPRIGWDVWGNQSAIHAKESEAV